MSAPAGWYPNPDMANTLRYWDGQRWTDNVSPIAAPPQSVRRGVESGVFWGILGAVLVIVFAGWFIYGVATANDDLECATENAERAVDGRPPLDCD